MRRDGKSDCSKTGSRAIPAMLAAAGLVLAVPVTGVAAVGSLVPSDSGLGVGYVPFTPAKIDPALAQRVADTLGVEGLRFTPAPRSSRGGERVVTMAVRVDQATARAITVRRTLADASVGTRGGTVAAMPMIEPTRYNLGTARGFQSFGAPAARSLAVPSGIRDISMPDLAAYRIDSERAGKPSRFQPRVAFEDRTDTGRSERTIEAAGQQSVEVGGAYRVLRNLDVTAGVRVSQDRNRIAPLTDGVEDDKAVYVGTQFRF